MNEINHFKLLLLYKMMWQMMWDGCWHSMNWLDIDIDTLHVKKINLNDTYLVGLINIVRVYVK
jgi:hypothetical protein